MLHVRKASAGSGKTYELTKIFIKLLLTSKAGGKKRNLRDEKSLKDALSSILAVTFTVKATAEMKERIVEKLAKLAGADSVTDDKLGDVEYLEDFMHELHRNRYEISHLAKKALETLLFHYSDFKVQTIDSFFQSILHTFAYEASLDDNFNMEIDTEYVSAIGFDAALETLSQTSDNSKTNRETLYWLRKLMGGKASTNKWNVFAKNENKNSLYRTLIKEADNLEKETFQNKRESILSYFDTLEGNFSDVVRKVDDMNFSHLKRLHNKRKEAAEILKVELNRAGLSYEHLFRGAGSKYKASLAEFDENEIKTDKLVPRGKEEHAHSLGSMGKELLKNAIRENPALNDTIVYDIDAAYDEWSERHAELLTLVEEMLPELNTWLEYRRMLPKLFLVLEIARKKREYLDSTNSLQISDTASILSRIIGSDDTPFVYERLGSRLNHFLIDEFQDTSQLQWDNFRPLLLDSESYDYDNLIIGDAKQSIYRFRNADYKLIMNIENDLDFKGKVVDYTSDYPPKDRSRENTNYRSKPRIVEFNNFIFSQITNAQGRVKDKEEKDKYETVDLFNEEVKNIYKDSVQALPKLDPKVQDRTPEGYVELIFHPSPEVSVENDKTTSWLNPANPGFRELPGRILELVGQGYRFKDIGVLVKSHDQGEVAVGVINTYNAANPKNQIDVISEENLLVGNALSVRLIIQALEVAVKGNHAEIEENELLKEPIGEQPVFELLKTLPTLSLPSLVEAIIEKFVPCSCRDKETPFLAAFQDAVLDYCTSHSGDIGSFLKWWKRKSKVLSINPPEGSDSVMIQTIHKAKGLEYRCVIIPYANFRFRPSRDMSEWKWVTPDTRIKGANLLPPYLPVETNENLEKTFHAELRRQYTEEVALDELNKMYVAFTRPKNELYVYLPMGKSEKGFTAAEVVGNMLYERDQETDEVSPRIEGWDAEGDEDGTVKVTLGSKADEVKLKAEREIKDKMREGKDPDPVKINIEGYKVSTEEAIAQFDEGNKFLNRAIYTGEGDHEMDPRAEGTLKHRVMQTVAVPADLKRGLLELKVLGLVSSAQMEKWGEELRNAIESVAHLGWFASDKRVINERPLLRQDLTINPRPDRVIVDPDGNATVIDYKFGEEDSKYKAQIRKYANLLSDSGQFRSVEAYLWYIPSGKIVRVT